MKKQPRIFLGLAEIAGYYKRLDEGFRELGVKSRFFSECPHKFHYEGKTKPNLFLRLSHWLRSRRYSRKVYPFNWVFHAIYHLSSRIFFYWSLVSYDVFIFGFRTYMVSLERDLSILKRWNKKVIFVFHGSDSRPPYLDGTYMDYSGEQILEIAKLQKEEIGVIDKYADYIINNTAGSHFHKRPIINWLIVGIPISTPSYCQERVVADEKRDFVRILHAPSNPKGKGTYVIREIIEELRREGHKIDYIEIIGKPHAEVINTLQSSDFVIDQVYSDQPMAGFATEAAWFGKPAIVGGFEIGDVNSHVTPDEVPPSLCCHPDLLKESILRLIQDEGYRKQLGAKAQQFVKERWNSKAVAERFMRIINDDMPSSWYFDPKEVNYYYGWGLTEERRNEQVNRTVATGGIEGLRLDHKMGFLKNLVEEVHAANIEKNQT